MAPRRRVRAFGLGCAALCAAAAAIAFMDWASPPDFRRFEDRSRIVADRDGTPLRVFLSGDDKWRLGVRPADVDPLYLRMLLAYEDRRFRSHLGVDPLAAGRAVLQAVGAGRIVSGASTLTMQAARLLEPRPRGLGAKAAEAFRALQLEARRGKDGVLAIYLTLAPFGGAVEGVRAASLKLFGREPAFLTPAEAALLVALPQSPSARRPDRYPDVVRRARARVLATAARAGILSEADRATAAAAPLPAAYRPMPFLAPHLAEALRAGVPGGVDVDTTIDALLQAQVERRLKAALATLPAPVNAAAVVVDAETAAVLALAGGGDYFARRRAGMNDLSLAVRSPGSALKPFVYGLAFDRLLARPDTLIADRPFRERGYAPSNFADGHAGEVTVAEALIRSLNIPAVKVLQRLGPARFDAALATVGVDLAFERDEGDPGLALALGGAGVDLRTLARTYLALHDGRVPDRLVYRPGETVVWRRLIGVDVAADLRRILARAPPPAGHDAAGLRQDRIAFKTGTSYGYRDAVAVGLAGGRVIAVWVGRPDGASCAGCVGIAVAAPILFDLARLGPDRPLPGLDLASAPTPPHLRRFERPAAAQSVASGARLSIQFPVDGAELLLGRSGRAPLVAVGGAGPYRWLVDGAPVGLSQPGAALAWRPPGPGYHRIVAVDGGGRSARAEIYVAVGTAP